MGEAEVLAIWPPQWGERKKEKKRGKKAENKWKLFAQESLGPSKLEGMLETTSACGIKVLKSTRAIIFGDIINTDSAFWLWEKREQETNLWLDKKLFLQEQPPLKEVKRAIAAIPIYTDVTEQKWNQPVSPTGTNCYIGGSKQVYSLRRLQSPFHTGKENRFF